jgi:nitrile hydratase beta subunit
VNGAHDLGGMMGFGPVAPERDEPVFHADWERRAFSLTLACGALGEWNIDKSRHARETLHPVVYLASSYYELWIEGLTRLLLARGLVKPDEIAAGRALHPRPPTRREPLRATEVAATLAKGGPCDRPVGVPPRFATGQRVRTRVTHPEGHIRLPRYARGKIGTVERVHGTFVFPDSNAHDRGENPTWVYSVVFGGAELWGEGADPSLTVAIDCWEPYLEKA